MFGHHYFGAHYFGPHYFGGSGTGSVVEPAYLMASVRIYAALGDIEVDIGPALDCQSVDTRAALDADAVNTPSGLEGDVELESALLGSPKANRRLN